jgi:hypothetical protein
MANKATTDDLPPMYRIEMQQTDGSWQRIMIPLYRSLEAAETYVAGQVERHPDQAYRIKEGSGAGQ